MKTRFIILELCFSSKLIAGFNCCQEVGPKQEQMATKTNKNMLQIQKKRSHAARITIIPALHALFEEKSLAQYAAVTYDNIIEKACLHFIESTCFI